MHILWDFDGTLMDTYPVYARTFKKALDVPQTEEEIFALLKVTFGHAFKTLGLTQEQCAVQMHVRCGKCRFNVSKRCA